MRSFGAAWQVGEFRSLWAAESLSQVGDQLARVALAILVYARTNSAALAALSLALSYTPALIGSALLSGLADRFPRREVMVACDLASVVLVLLMAVPGMPLAVVCVAMAGVSLVGGPFKAARLALLPEVVSGDAYVAALALRSITIQCAQLLGFAGGGVLAGVIDPHVALVADAVTFGVSALLVRFGVRSRPAAASPAARRSFWASSLDGVRLIRAVPGLGSLFGLGMLAGLYIAPEGLGAAWIAELGAPPAAVGLVMGAPAAGLVVGAWLFTSFVPGGWRERLVGPLAAASGLALAGCVFEPGLLIVLVLLVLSGVGTAYQLQVGASFGTLTPANGRAQVMGLLNSGALTVQGLGMLAAGALAEQLGVARTVALAGSIGALLAGVAWVRSSRARARSSAPAT